MKVRKIYVCCGLLALTLAGACATAKPAWITGKSADYQDQAYLTGVGFDTRRGVAEDRARAEVAKIFEVKVEATDAVSESALLTRLDQVRQEEYTQSASSRVETSTAKVMRGVRIVELFTDEDSGLTYALAALDRARTARELRENLASIDTTVAHHVEMAEQSGSAPVRLSHYLQAIDANRDRKIIAADLRIVDPAGWAPLARQPHGALVAAAERAAKEVKITVKLTGDPRGIVTGAVVRALNDIGMQVVTENANIVLSGQIDLEQYQRQNANWAVAMAQVELIADDGTLLDANRIKERESSQVGNMAATLAYERLGDKLASVLVQRIGRMGR